MLSSQLGTVRIVFWIIIYHIRENFNIFDFALTDEEMAEIAKVDKGVRYYTATPDVIAQYAKTELKPDL